VMWPAKIYMLIYLEEPGIQPVCFAVVSWRVGWCAGWWIRILLSGKHTKHYGTYFWKSLFFWCMGHRYFPIMWLEQSYHPFGNGLYYLYHLFVVKWGLLRMVYDCFTNIIFPTWFSHFPILDHIVYVNHRRILAVSF
jgi:hypothetical protein